jgi:hypothetical protein
MRVRAASAANGAPSNAQSMKSNSRNPISAMKSTAIRCAPAPSNDSQADSKIAVGNSNASARTIRGCGIVAASARNTGYNSAARPDVEGTMNAVAAIS